ncbi:MAG: DNA cytosine methyltransferase [Pseudomonadota bacterium]
MNYYNENDAKTAAWLRELISQGYLPDGHVDDRSITDIRASDLKGFVQHHFFAGIGGWPYALALAGWPGDKPVWTGSCPCQPFSLAGKKGGMKDERHLWPVWFELVRTIRPAIIFGEQVASQAALQWFDQLAHDMEGIDYTTGAAALPAAGVAAPHKRERLFFVALAHTNSIRSQGGLPKRQIPDPGQDGHVIASPGLPSRALGHTEGKRCNEKRERIDRPAHRPLQRDQWSGDSVVWWQGRDGKSRPVKSGINPLANGVPARVVRLRGYGNAIVPQIAAQFVGAYMEATNELLHGIERESA